MSTTSAGAAELPAALADWSASLSGLQVRVAVALGPMLLRLDELVARQGGVGGRSGEPDGFDGLTRHGSPEHLLIAEWLLAEDFPDEFLRRAVQGESLHLAPARRQDPPHGVVRVLTDTGPGQLGAGRLVQLAALIVLHRRSMRIGATLEVGVLGATPGTWLTGELPELLAGWLADRRRTVPTASDVRAWLSSGAGIMASGGAGTSRAGTSKPVRTPGLGAPPERADVWLLCAPELAAAVTAEPRPAVARSRILAGREAGWDAAGTRSVRVELAAEHLVLPVPAGPDAIRALRGQGFHRFTRTDHDSPPSGLAELRLPFFPGPSRRLIGRGRGRKELCWTTVHGPGTSRTELKQRRFSGPVLAAGMVGSRLIVLHGHGTGVKVSVIGKSLGRFDTLMPLGDLDLEPGLAEADPSGPLSPLFFDAGSLLYARGDHWYRIAGDGSATRDETIAAVIATATPDRPQIAYRDLEASPDSDILAGARGVSNSSPRQSVWAISTRATVRQGHGWTAWGTDRGQWRLGRAEATHQIMVDDDTAVFGVVQLGSEPMLVTGSHSGLALRLAQTSGARALDAWPDGEPFVSVAPHPTLPLVAVASPDRTVTVVDLQTDHIVHQIVPQT